MRIVSLLPSATEILFAVGAGDDVVGVTFECDRPAEARTRTVVSTSALPPAADGRSPTPAEIDTAVRERLAAGEDLYHLDRGALAGLDADLVLTQDLCAVCAVDVSEVHDALGFLGCRAEVLTTDPHTLAEVWQSIHDVGRAIGRADAAAELVAGLRERLARVRQQVAAHAGPGPGPPPRVAVLEWTDPPFAPGHWVPEMVAAAGGESVLGTAGQKSVTTSWEAVRAARPDVVVVAPCGYELPGSAGVAEELLSTGVLDATGASVWAVDANASFARPGPALVDGIEALAALLHPGLGQRPDPAMARCLRTSSERRQQEA